MLISNTWFSLILYCAYFVTRVIFVFSYCYLKSHYTVLVMFLFLSLPFEKYWSYLFIFFLLLFFSLTLIYRCNWDQFKDHCVCFKITKGLIKITNYFYHEYHLTAKFMYALKNSTLTCHIIFWVFLTKQMNSKSCIGTFLCISVIILNLTIVIMCFHCHHCNPDML